MNCTFAAAFLYALVGSICGAAAMFFWTRNVYQRIAEENAHLAIDLDRALRDRE